MESIKLSWLSLKELFLAKEVELATYVMAGKVWTVLFSKLKTKSEFFCKVYPFCYKLELLLGLTKFSYSVILCITKLYSVKTI